MTELNNDIRELNINELDAVSGGFDIVQTAKDAVATVVQAIVGGGSLGIGSQSTGAGAGKVTFNPFSIS